MSIEALNGLLLRLLVLESNESEASSLAGLVAGLKLADHESGDGTESDLGRGWLELGEQLEELRECQ